MIAAYKKKSELAAMVFAVVLVLILAMAFVAPVIGASDQFANAFIAICGIVLGCAFWVSAWFYVKAKGRSGWWVLVLLVLSIFGVLILWLLKDLAVVTEKKQEIITRL